MRPVLGRRPTSLQRCAQRALRGLLLCTGLAAPIGLHAQVAADYPAHALRLVVPYPPGGIVDIVARATAAALTRELGQPVVVDNRAGAGGTIGMKAVADAAADGYTLGLATTGPLAIMPAMQRAPAFDAARAFAPVSLVATAPQVMLVASAVPVKSVQQLVAYARAHPGKLAYASAGIGTTGHLAGALFESLADVDLLHVPYTGNQAALRDVLAGRVQMLFSPLAPVLPYVRDGKLRALAVAGEARSPLVPSVPTVAEAGVPGAEAPVWYGLVAPAGTSPAVIGTVQRALRAAMAQGTLPRQLREAGTDPVVSSPEDFRRLIADDSAKWKRIVDERGIRAE